VTDSETFYSSILELLEDPDERLEVVELLIWWNRYLSLFGALQSTDNPTLSQIFPHHANPSRVVAKNSALARIKEKRAAQKAQAQLADPRE